MTQLAQRLGFDLADTFTGDVELLTNFLEGAGVTVLNAEAQTQYLFLTGRQRLEYLDQLLLEQHERSCLSRFGRIVVRDEVAEVGVFLLTDRGLERYRLLCDLEDIAHAVNRHVHLGCNLLGRRVMTQLLKQLTGYADDLIDGLNHVYRNTDGTRLVCNRTGDCLTNPPGCVGRELKALGVVELLNRLDQTQITLLNQVQEEHAAANVTLCDGYNQSQVGLCQTLLGTLASLDRLVQCGNLVCADCNCTRLGHCVQLLSCLIALEHLLCQIDLFLRGQQINLTDLLEVHTYRVVDREALGKRRRIYQLFFGHFLDCRCLELFVVVTERYVEHACALNLDALVLEHLVDLIDLVGLKLQRRQRIRNLLEGQFTVLLTSCHQILDDLHLLRELFCTCHILFASHFICFHFGIGDHRVFPTGCRGLLQLPLGAPLVHDLYVIVECLLPPLGTLRTG